MNKGVFNVHEDLNVYKVTFDLIVHKRRQECSDTLTVVAPSVETTLKFANEEKKTMRRQAVNRELAVRAIECLHDSVLALVPASSVETKEWEADNQ